MLALCQHNTLAYYAFYYAGIFDAGLDGRLPQQFLKWWGHISAEQALS